MPEQTNTKQSSVSVSDCDYQFHEYPMGVKHFGDETFITFYMVNMLPSFTIDHFQTKIIKRSYPFLGKFPTPYMTDWLNYDTVNYC